MMIRTIAVRTLALTLLAAAFIFFSPGRSSAEELTVEEAVAEAMQNAESVRIDERRAESLRAEGRAAAAYAYPQAVVSAGYMEIETNAEALTGLGGAAGSTAFGGSAGFDFTPERTISAGFELSQVIWAGGRIKSSLALRETIREVADLLAISGRRDLRREVRRAYYDALLAKALLGVEESRETQRREEMDDALLLEQVGMVTRLDVRQARQRLHSTLSSLENARERQALALNEFNLVIGRTPVTGREPAEPANTTLPPPPPLGERLAALKKALSRGAQLDINLASASYFRQREELAINKGGRWPEFRLALQGETEGEEFGEMDETLLFGLQMRWNIYDGGQTLARSDVARSEMRAARLELIKRRRELAAALSDLETKRESLRRKTALAEENLKLSEENYEDARGHYRAGTITLTRLGEFSLALSEARFSLLSLYHEGWRLLIEVESLLEAAEGMRSLPGELRKDIIE